MELKEGAFYIVKDSFYDSMPDCGLLFNKESDENGVHGRPCVYCFRDGGYCWMVPISSRVRKYQAVMEHKAEKFGSCDNILLGNVYGQMRAFLIQNAFPCKEEHIVAPYWYDKDKTPVYCGRKMCAVLHRRMKKVVSAYRAGKSLTISRIACIIQNMEREG